MASQPARALVNSASRGIGLSFAEHLARNEHDLVMVTRGQERLSAVADRVRSNHAVEVEVIWVGVGDQPGGNRTDSAAADVNLNGSWLGLMVQSVSDAGEDISPFPGDRLTAGRFGRRIARVTTRWMAAADDHPLQPVSEQEAGRRKRTGHDEWRRHDD